MSKQYQVAMTEVEYNDWLEHLTYPPNLADVKKPNKKEFGEDCLHPTVKPVKLMEWLIKLTTNESDFILDPFCGSGTTLVACENLNRNGIGIEMSSDYWSTIKSRAPNSTLLKGDCIEIMRQMDADSVDAILTDPPYNISMANWDSFKTNKDFGLWMEQVATEAYRVLRPGGIVCSFAAARTYHYTAMAFDNAGFQCRDMIEWCFWSGMPKGKNLKGCHEPIYLGWKPMKNLDQFTFNIDACRIPVKEKRNKKTNQLETITIGNKTIPVKEL